MPFFPSPQGVIISDGLIPLFDVFPTCSFSTGKPCPEINVNAVLDELTHSIGPSLLRYMVLFASEVTFQTEHF